MALFCSGVHAQNSANLNSPLGMNVREWSYWQTELAPVDYFKRAGNGRNPPGIWLTQAAGTWDTGEEATLDLDPSGWPRSLSSAAATRYRYLTTILIRDTDKYPGGRWTVLYDGEGSLTYGGDALRNAAASSPGRDIFDVATPRSGFTLSITNTDPHQSGNYLRNIRVIPPGGTCNGDAFSYAADTSVCPASYRPFTETYSTQPFHPLFLADMRPFSAVRYLHFAAIVTTQVSSWADRPHLGDASYSLDRGVPWELALDLANVLNASPWLEIPARADDDYVTEFARLAKARYTGTRPIYMEYYNEAWNGNYPYNVNGSWIEDQANARWPVTTPPQSGFTKRINWFALRTKQICGIWKREFADQPGRIQCVMGAQSGNAWVARQALACPLHAAETGGTACNAGAGIDALAIAPYFGSYISNAAFQPTVETWLAMPDGGLGKLFEEINSGILPRSISPGNGTPVAGLSQILSAMAFNKREADAGGVKLVTYEGGQEMGPSGSSAYQNSLQTLFANANRDPRMGLVYKAMLDGWRAAGGELNMLFQSTGAYTASRGNSPYKEWQGQPVAQAPKYQAALDFIAANPCWWVGCIAADTQAPAAARAAPTVTGDAAGPLNRRTINIGMTPPASVGNRAGHAFVAALLPVALGGGIYLLSASGNWSAFATCDSAPAVQAGPLGTPLALSLVPAPMDLTALKGTTIYTGYGIGSTAASACANMVANMSLSLALTID